MIGDSYIPKAWQMAAAQHLFGHLKRCLQGDRPLVAIAGESGSGKSEIAFELARIYERAGLPAFVFQQDDYFFYPPKTNDAMRRKNLKQVGLGEVNLKLLDEHLSIFRQAPAKHIKKPVVIFREDRVVDEKIDPNAFRIGIVEGTYTSLLNHVNCRVFIDRSYHDTLEDRQDRRRDKLDDFIEEVLEIEHRIISKHKSMADFIVSKDSSVMIMEEHNERGKGL